MRWANGERSEHELANDPSTVARMASLMERMYLSLEADRAIYDGRGDELWAMVLAARGEVDASGQERQR